MDWKPLSVFRWLFDSEHGASDCLIPRCLFLRALGLIYFSAFLSLLFQICGLIGPAGILPANEYLQAVANSLGHARYWYAPTLLWFNASSHMLRGLCWTGLVGSVFVTFNIWPRGMLAVCFVCFISVVSAASEFSGYQSDGMLLEAGFISLFLAPQGWRPGLGRWHPPIRASVFLLLWEWFRIYFESGIAKIASGDPEWRHFTAMDLFLPRRWRIICFCIVTPWQIAIILTANYTFLNYLVLVLGFLLLDDSFLAQFLPRRWKERFLRTAKATAESGAVPASFRLNSTDQLGAAPSMEASVIPKENRGGTWAEQFRTQFAFLRIPIIAVVFAWLFYTSTLQMIWMIRPGFPLPASPVAALEPLRIAGRYGLFAVMTRGRYEIEFQGSADGQNWVTYPFRFKPQDARKAPGIYAPYQPRFDWNLWFASLGEWRSNPIVPNTEERLLTGSTDVLSLFAGNPFPHEPPRQVRAVIWQYWFTTPFEKRTQGLWWRRELLGLYAPTLEREADGKIAVVQWPNSLAPRE